MKQNNASVIIFRRGHKIACIHRQNTGWYDGYYALPGGKVDPGESFTHAAIREAKEEVGLNLTTDNLEILLVAHIKGEDGAIWVNVLFEAHDWSGELFNAEPNKSSELVWQDIDSLPENTVPNTHVYLKALAAGKHYVECGWKN
jgi:ADP-ribose pyrophosphatase YjhB (NUDIX family)